MKHDGFSYIVHAEVTFTISELNALTWMSFHHYDSLCKSYGKEGGLINTMLKRQLWAKEELEDVVPTALTFKDVDVMCKILEPTFRDDQYEYPSAIYNLRGDLIGLIHKLNAEQKRLQDEEEKS